MPNRILFILVVSLACVCSTPAQGSIQILPGDAVEVAHAAELQHPTDFTFEAWVQTDLHPNGPSVVAIKRSAYRVDWQGDAFVGKVWWAGGGTDSITSSATYTIGTWTHVALRADAAADLVTLWCNGVLEASLPMSGRTLRQSNQNLYLGHAPNLGANAHLIGKLDEVRIWNRARSDLELADGMQLPLHRSTGLVASWHFDGNANDAAGSNHGTILGQPTFSEDQVFYDPFPGSGADLRMRSALIPPGQGRNALDSVAIKAIRGGWGLETRLDSPGRNIATTGVDVYLAIQVVPFGSTTMPSPLLPDLHIDLNRDYELLPLSGSSEPDWVVGALPDLFNFSVVLQWVIITNQDPRGYLTTAAQRFDLPRAVAVDAASSAPNPTGEFTAPFPTITEGYQAAVLLGFQDVIVAQGDYSEFPAIVAPVNFLGGLDPVDWTGDHADPQFRSRVNLDQRGLQIDGVNQEMEIRGFHFTSQDGVRPTVNESLSRDMASVAADIRRCGPELRLVSCTFEAGAGAGGRAGLGGSPGTSTGGHGLPGRDGNVMVIGDPRRDGGAGGSGGGGSGGDGGRVGWNSSSLSYVPDDGRDGSSGGSGGPRGGFGGDGRVCNSGRNGTNGLDGSRGDFGALGASPDLPIAGEIQGHISGTGSWRPVISAGSGARGDRGEGGGGGGGGGSSTCVGVFHRGSSGGGGGGGGQGGAGGSAGSDGGASIAMWIFDASPTILDCLFISGQGGDGGPGGNGGRGAAGGRGGNGGDQGVHGGGGNGGDGGDGGGGGAGAGGTGGGSWAIAVAGTTTLDRLQLSRDNVLNVGSPGSFGQGGNTPHGGPQGNPGRDGTGAEIAGL